jgi:hypothetical protein
MDKKVLFAVLMGISKRRFFGEAQFTDEYLMKEVMGIAEDDKARMEELLPLLEECDAMLVGVTHLHQKITTLTLFSTHQMCNITG